MRSVISFLVCLLLLLSAACLGATEWAKRGGGSMDDEGRDIAVDANGNSYVTGQFLGTATFGTYSLTSSGGNDIFIAKLDPSGNYLWAVKAGGSSGDYAYGIVVDNNGNVYITGIFYGTANFGIYSLISSGSGDVFVAKISSGGTWLWANRGGGTGYDAGQDLILDGNGNSYITGTFSVTATFGATSLTSSGSYDILIAKLDTNGTWLWAKKAGGTGIDQGRSVGKHPSGYLHVAGYYSDAAAFGTNNLTSAGGYDAFVTQLDQNGNWLWTTSAGGTGTDVAYGIAVDTQNRIFITGSFNGVSNFNSNQLSSSGTDDIFVARLDYFGTWVWAVKAGASSTDQGWGVATDGNGYAYVTGVYTNTAYFGTTWIPGSGGADGFIARLDVNGNWLWVRRVAYSGYDFGYGIATNGSGYCYVTGLFTSYAFFGSIQLDSVGGTDIYIARVEDPIPNTPQNISIANFGYDVEVDWDPVSVDTWGYAIQPDYCFVYYNTDGTGSPYHYLTFIPAPITEYVHQNAGFFSSNHFYQVTAVKFYLNNRTNLDSWLSENLREGMTTEEVNRVLSTIGIF